MSKEPGEDTRRRGLKQVKRGIFDRRVIAILGATVALEVGIIVGGSAIARAFGIPTNTTLTAFVLGVLVATVILLMTGMVAVMTGGVNWITGSMAERLTGKTLSALGPEWRTLHNLVFKEGPWEPDVDHVPVGPYGVLVLETKYSSSPPDLSAQRLANQARRDIAQTRRNGERIERVLHQAGSEVPIRPVLVLGMADTKAPRAGSQR